jgi:glutamine synthetase adenylyltransferase
LTANNTALLIDALAKHKLLPPADAANLVADYRFLAQLENRLRIETDSAMWALPPTLDKLTPLARRMGFSGPDGARVMLDELNYCRKRIRAIFTRCFQAEQGPPD